MRTGASDSAPKSVAVSGDVVECAVARPPAEKPAALALAREQHAYCYDIVEQGVGTTAKLALVAACREVLVFLVGLSGSALSPATDGGEPS